MYNYYVILMGYFNKDHQSSDANNILMKFSNLYIKNKEKKNISPRSG